MLVRALVMTLLLLLLPAGAAPAQAADSVLAPAPDAAGITAYAGHVVFSQRDPATGKWSLVHWHSGVIDALPVAGRGVPFDADAGPDAAGHPVVVYSRCRHDPAMPEGLPPTPDWQTAQGCDIYELSLTGQPREHKLVTASSASRSETTPSIWRGALAFARHADGSAGLRVEYVPAAASRLRRLGGGSVQACLGACGFRVRQDGVDQLDLGPSRVAYVWRMTGGSVYGGVVWELRAAPLAGGRSTLLDTGLVSGACGFRLPNAPTMSGRLVGYLDAGAACDVTETRFAIADTDSGARAASQTPGGLAAGAVRDGTTIYWLRVANGASRPPVPGAGSCSMVDAQCELVDSAVPSYDAQPPGPQGPPADIDPVRSGLGYRWVAGPAGTRLLRPPVRVPCAPSARPVRIYTSVQWHRGRHTVRVLRHDPHTAPRQVGIPLTRSLPTGVANQTRLLHCGDHPRLTYAVTTGRAIQRMSFAVSRARSIRSRPTK